jgi:hypothetical protein
MNAGKWVSRRMFLKGTACATAVLGVAPNIIPAGLLGADAPSNKINVGFIGVGDHGTGWNLSYYLRNKTARVIAVCDVDDNHLVRAKETVDERYGNEDCFSTKDFRRFSRVRTWIR